MRKVMILIVRFMNRSASLTAERFDSTVDTILICPVFAGADAMFNTPAAAAIAKRMMASPVRYRTVQLYVCVGGGGR